MFCDIASSLSSFSTFSSRAMIQFKSPWSVVCFFVLCSDMVEGDACVEEFWGMIFLFFSRKKDKPVVLSEHILDLYYIQLSNTDPFYENYAKLYFDAKYLEKGFNR